MTLAAYGAHACPHCTHDLAPCSPTHDLYECTWCHRFFETESLTNEHDAAGSHRRFYGTAG